MSALIVYMSLHGCADKAARRLADISWQQVDLVNLRNQSPPPIDSYKTVIIGGSVHMGQVQGKIRRFCNDNEDELLTKRVGLYLCHLYEGEEAVKQFNDAYSEKLRKHAISKGLFGGEFNMEKMSIFEKAIVKKTTGLEGSISRIDDKAIEAFGKVIFHLDKS